MKTLEEWVNDLSDKVLRMLELRKPGQYTPYEMENKFIDESLYKDNHYTHIQIKELIELPDKDVLVGYRVVYDLESLNADWSDSIIYYKKLSEIELSHFPGDENAENWA